MMLHFRVTTNLQLQLMNLKDFGCMLRKKFSTDPFSKHRRTDPFSNLFSTGDCFRVFVFFCTYNFFIFFYRGKISVLFFNFLAKIHGPLAELIETSVRGPMITGSNPERFLLFFSLIFFLDILVIIQDRNRVRMAEFQLAPINRH